MMVRRFLPNFSLSWVKVFTLGERNCWKVANIEDCQPSVYSVYRLSHCPGSKFSLLGRDTAERLQILKIVNQVSTPSTEFLIVLGQRFHSWGEKLLKGRKYWRLSTKCLLRVRWCRKPDTLTNTRVFVKEQESSKTTVSNCTSTNPLLQRLESTAVFHFISLKKCRKDSKDWKEKTS